MKILELHLNKSTIRVYNLIIFASPRCNFEIHKHKWKNLGINFTKTPCYLFMYLESRGRAGICFWARTVFIPSQIIWALSGSDTRRISWDTRNTSLISTNHLTWTNPNNRDSFFIRIHIWFSVKKRFCSINISHPLSKNNLGLLSLCSKKERDKGKHGEIQIFRGASTILKVIQFWRQKISWNLPKITEKFAKFLTKMIAGKKIQKRGELTSALFISVHLEFMKIIGLEDVWCVILPLAPLPAVLHPYCTSSSRSRSWFHKNLFPSH